MNGRRKNYRDKFEKCIDNIRSYSRRIVFVNLRSQSVQRLLKGFLWGLVSCLVILLMHLEGPSD